MTTKSYASEAEQSFTKTTISVKKIGSAFQGRVKSAGFCIWESPITGTLERARQMASEHAELILSIRR